MSRNSIQIIETGPFSDYYQYAVTNIGLDQLLPFRFRVDLDVMANQNQFSVIPRTPLFGMGLTPLQWIRSANSKTCRQGKNIVEIFAPKIGDSFSFPFFFHTYHNFFMET